MKKAILLIVIMLVFTSVAYAQAPVQQEAEINQSEEVPDSLTITEVTEDVKEDIVIEEIVIEKKTVKTVEQEVSEYTQAEIPAGKEEIIKIIKTAAAKYGVSEVKMLRIADCESGYNQNAVNRSYYDNGHPSGLFQHISGYWPARATKYGYDGASVFDPIANANVTAGMMRDGLSGLWECK